MINMTQYTTKKTIADNTIIVNGCKFENITDELALAVMDLLLGKVDVYKDVEMIEEPKKVLHLEDEKPAKKVVKYPGKPVYQDDFTTVTEVEGEYRLFVHCHVAGDKGDKIRFAIKQNAKKDFGAEYAKDSFNGEFGPYWVFPSKAKAQAYSKSRRDYAKKNSK